MEALTIFGQCLLAAAGMFWTMLWALILGFALSGMTIVFVPKKKVAGLLGRSGPTQLGLAIFFGAASSSCSYAAAAMTKTLFKKGAHIISALAFLLASTNMVVELSLVLGLLMGWQFVVAEFLGGVILILIMALLMKLIGPLKDFEAKQNELSGNADAHADGLEKTADPRTLEAWRQVAQAFVMEWKMIWKDILIGVTISGFLMVLVPETFWQTLFLKSHDANASALQLIENAAVGPLVSMLSFVCSVGNIPLANVLYHAGIGFGGALSFIFADLIIIPLILVYKKYFGLKLALWITAIFYISMVLAGIFVDLLFHWLGWVPSPRSANDMTQMHLFAFNYTFWLNLGFMSVAALLFMLAKSAKPAHSACAHHSH